MNADLKPYPGYKDSGLTWPREVPNHWEVVPNRSLLKIRKQIVGDNSKDFKLLSLTLQGIIPRDLDNPEGKFPAEFNSYQVVEPGDLVFCLFDIDETPRTVGISGERGMITGAYTVFSCIDPLVANFLYLLYLAVDEQKGLRPFYTGLRKVVQKSTFMSIKVALPPETDRSAIVTFLRQFDIKVQRLIRNRRRLIKVLNEQKQAIINQAVTRGLNPKTSHKPSGIDWLGDIPEHWEVLRGKYLFREVDLRSGTGDETHLSMSQRHGLIPSSDMSERRLMSDSYVGGKLCDKDDLVLNRLKAHLGVFALAPESGLVSPDYTVFRATRSICLPFYEYLYRTPLYCAEYRKRVKGIVQGFWRLYTDDFYDIPVPFPPISEQEMIVRRLTQDLSRIDAAIERAYQEIDLVHEYRTRLLADVVTGKIDVSDLAPSSGDEELGFELEELDQVNDVDGILGDDEPTLIEEAADAGD